MNKPVRAGGCVKHLSILPFIMLVQPAIAQRADENAATSAEDGFGKSVGDESVGIYASGNVRGFSAYDAGNARIEGLYYNESGSIIDLTQRSACTSPMHATTPVSLRTVHVELAAKLRSSNLAH